jgi:hypothetical protein
MGNAALKFSSQNCLGEGWLSVIIFNMKKMIFGRWGRHFFYSQVKASAACR